MNIGKLILVGAGPGDPELLTLKAVKALNKADVILYDALVNKEILSHAKEGSTLVFVGKRCGKHSHQQEEINQLIVDYALQGKIVCRLKAGDPFVFGRGREEMDFVAKHGISTEICLGISSLNLPGKYGIPVTMRGINESFWVLTASNREGGIPKDIELAAKSTATKIIFMGLKRLEAIMDVFKNENQHTTPVAIISKGSHSDEKILLSTVEQVVSKSKEEKIKAPAIIVVGEVVRKHEFFESDSFLEEMNRFEFQNRA